MRKLIVTQTGVIQVQGSRRFLVEVPDDFTTTQVEKLLQETQFGTDADEAEWSDESGSRWVGFDVEGVDTDVCDPDTVLGSPNMEGLKVISLGMPAEMNMQ